MKVDPTKKALETLAANDRGGWTQPAAGLYPHQWLWDSCFIAIGLAHTDPARGAIELLSLLRGQWRDGFIPHMIYADSADRWETELWRGGDPELTPSGVKTSTITQPPLLAVASERVAAGLAEDERKKFLATMVPAVLAHHLWLYRNRRPANSGGLVGLIHPWESGMDDSPPWLSVMASAPWFSIPNFLRSDYRYVKPQDRPTGQEVRRLLDLAIALRHYRRNERAMLAHLPVQVADLVFNSILVWNNEALVRLAKQAEIKLPDEFHIAARQNLAGLKRLWDDGDEQFYHYDLRLGNPIKVPSIATFAPLLTSAPTAEQVARLSKLLRDPRTFGLPHPIPTVPADSPDFHPDRYWQGPTWTNLNWLIVQGLRRHGRHDQAERLSDRTRKLVEHSGCREYFSPRTGEGLGAQSFSWTAALYLDLVQVKS